MKDLEELTTHCIRCGFCLESCPTFTETGDETQSPRGRIYLVRSAVSGQVAWDDIQNPISQCLGCRACETACPSGVQYGHILEMARARLLPEKPPQARLLAGLTHPSTLKLQLLAAKFLPSRRVPGFLASALSSEPQQADIPERQILPRWPDLVESELPPIKGDVWLLEGCAIGVLFPRVQLAARRLLRRAGYQVRRLDGCCGALHAHAGMTDEARRRALELVTRAPDLPVVVTSAGCGSTMKEYGDLFEGGVAAEFAGRVRDLSEFLFEEGLVDIIRKGKGVRQTVTYHDACHLAHGQRVTEAPRKLLSAIPGVDLVPLKESDMCCGSAGTYNLTHPTMARRLLDRKWNHVAETGARWLVLGNPGCHAWIEQAARENGGAVKVLHLAEALEAAIGGYFI